MTAPLVVAPLVARPAPTPTAAPQAKPATAPLVASLPAGKPAPQPVGLPDTGATRRRGLGLLGQQAMSRSAPALQLLPKPHLPAAPPLPAESVGGLASLIALARAGRGDAQSLGREHEPLALLRDELLALLALADEPPESDAAPTTPAP